MSHKRIMSIESNIYHRLSCKYVDFMKPGNKKRCRGKMPSAVAVLADTAIV